MIHILTDTFKTQIIKLYTAMPVDINTQMIQRMMTKLMNRVSPQYKTRQSFMNTLEMYYGSSVQTSTGVLGNHALTTSTIRLISGHMVGEVNLLEDVLTFAIHDIFEQTFDNEAIFEQEKQVLLHQYKTLTNHKTQYATMKFKEVLYDNHPENFPLKDLIQVLETLTLLDIKTFYQNTFLNAPKIAFATGPFSNEEKTLLQNKINPYLKGEIQIQHERLSYQPFKEIVNTLDVEQAMIHIAYHLPIYKDETYHIPAHLMTMILGYHGDSRLFRIVREEQGLCYVVYAQYDDEKGYMVIYTGVDHRAQDQAISSIQHVVESMKDGITDKELNDVKQAMIHQITSNLDKQTAQMDRVFRQTVYGTNYDLETRLKQIEAVTKEEIKLAAEMLRLMLIHRTVGENHA